MIRNKIVSKALDNQFIDVNNMDNLKAGLQAVVLRTSKEINRLLEVKERKSTPSNKSHASDTFDSDKSKKKERQMMIVIDDDEEKPLHLAIKELHALLTHAGKLHWGEGIR